jgi:hypothetical protein
MSPKQAHQGCEFILVYKKVTKPSLGAQTANEFSLHDFTQKLLQRADSFPIKLNTIILFYNPIIILSSLSLSFFFQTILLSLSYQLMHDKNLKEKRKERKNRKRKEKESLFHRWRQT